MSREFDVFFSEAPSGVVEHWGWLVALGVVVAVIGGVAIWRARATTLLYVGFLGALLVVAAAAVLIFAFSLTGYWTDFFVHVLWAVLLAITGVVLLTRPSISAEAITLAIALYLIATGVFGICFALFAHVREEWLHASEGLVNVFLGLLLLLGWPISGLFAIGLFLGIDLILRGIAMVALGLTLRNMAQ